MNSNILKEAEKNFVTLVFLGFFLAASPPGMAQPGHTPAPGFFVHGHRGITLTTMVNRDITFPALHRAIALGWQFRPDLGLNWDISLSRFPWSGLNPGSLFPIGSLWMFQTGAGYRTEGKRIYTQWIAGALLSYYYSRPMSEYEPSVDMILEWIELEVDTRWNPNFYLEGRVGVFLGKYFTLTGFFMVCPNVREPLEKKGFDNLTWGLLFGFRG